LGYNCHVGRIVLENWEYAELTRTLAGGLLCGKPGQSGQHTSAEGSIFTCSKKKSGIIQQKQNFLLFLQEQRKQK
jgi:hypothetical protein